LGGQSVGTPGATQVDHKGQDTGKKNQADKPPQAKFQHGLAMTPDEV
jgi:hypothetical protein